MDADELIAKVRIWSQSDDRVTAAGLCGSHARGEARPDSDIDFCIMTPDPGTLLEDRSWVYELGANAQVQEDIEDYGLVQSIRVLYGAIEAEFGITEEAWADPPIDRETACVICNGLRVLHDPEGRLDRAIILARAYGNSTG